MIHLSEGTRKKTHVVIPALTAVSVSEEIDHLGQQGGCKYSVCYMLLGAFDNTQ